MDPWIVNDTTDQCLICLLEIWAWLAKCYLRIDISTINPLNVIHKNPHSHSPSHFLVSLPARFRRLKPCLLSSQMLTSPAGHVSSLPDTSLPPPWFITPPSAITRGWAAGLPNWRLFHHLGLQIEESFKIINQLLELPSLQSFCASHERCSKNIQKTQTGPPSPAGHCPPETLALGTPAKLSHLRGWRLLFPQGGPSFPSDLSSGAISWTFYLRQTHPPPPLLITGLCSVLPLCQSHQ